MSTGEHVSRQHSNAEVVVLIPGAGDIAASWQPVSRDLSTSAEVVTWDRVHSNDTNPDRFTVSGYLVALDRLVETTSPDSPVVLVGHSLGGLIARLYARQNPERVRGLVLVDATPEAIAGDRAVKAGFLAGGLMAYMFRLLARLGLVRWLVEHGHTPLYPEQPSYRKAATPTGYKQWQVDVTATFAGPTMGRELRSVLHVAASAAQTLPGQTDASEVRAAVLASRAYGSKWQDMQTDVAEAVSAECLHLTHESHHNIHMTHPHLVAQAARRLLVTDPTSQP